MGGTSHSNTYSKTNLSVFLRINFTLRFAAKHFPKCISEGFWTRSISYYPRQNYKSFNCKDNIFLHFPNILQWHWLILGKSGKRNDVLGWRISFQVYQDKFANTFLVTASYLWAGWNGRHFFLIWKKLPSLKQKCPYVQCYFDNGMMTVIFDLAIPNSECYCGTLVQLVEHFCTL